MTSVDQGKDRCRSSSLSESLSEVELARIGEERWAKLRQYFGVSQADIAAYADFQNLNRTKVQQLLGQVPSVDEHIRLQERNRNVQIETMLQRWHTEMDEFVRFRQVSVGVTPESSAKSSRLLGVSDKDVDYYTRFGKAVRVLGDSPLRQG